MDLRGREVQQRCGGNSLESHQWGKISGVQAPALCSPWMGCQQEGGWASRCKDDKADMQYGRQRSDSYRASGSILNRFLLRCAAYHAGPVCTHIPFFCCFSPLCFLMQGALLLPSHRHVLKSCQKLEPEGDREGRRDRRRERCNRIITQGTSLKGTAAGGPIWALHQQTHTSIATTTGSQCCLIMADKDECISSQLLVQSFRCVPTTVFPVPPNPRLQN